MFIKYSQRQFLLYFVASLATTLFLLGWGRKAIAAASANPNPTWFTSFTLFSLIVYGSIGGLTIATIVILAIWLKELQGKSVW